MQRLIDHHHRFADIGEYTLDQFIMFLDAVEMSEAASRIAFTTDVAVAAAGIFDSKGIMKHLESLQQSAYGE